MKIRRGFTIVELMIALAVMAVLLTLAAPSFYDFILVQRLKGVNAQLVTDMQFARSEATSRFERRSDQPGDNVEVQVVFRPTEVGAALSCYTLYTDSSDDPRDKCDCTAAAGMRCPAASTQEIRTVQLPTSQRVLLGLPARQARGFSFLSTSGAISIWRQGFTVPLGAFQVEAYIDADRRLRTSIGLSGRPSVCSPDGGVSGYAPC